MKGFTLVELLGVILILGVLILITVPSLGKMIEDAKKRGYEFQITQIESAAKSWASDNILFKIADKDVVTITLAQLKVGNYIDKDIRNPIDKKYFPNDMEILIKRTGLSVDVDVLVKTGTDIDEFNANILVFTLFGKVIENVEINTVYTEPGIVFNNSLGEEVPSTMEITRNGSVVTEIVEEVVGNYIVTYTANNGSSISKVVRSVNVVDTIPPVISITGSLEVTVANIGNLDLREGVSVTDNSLAIIGYTMEGQVEPQIGNYAINYTAIDPSGNVSTKSRLVKVIAN